MSELLSIVAIEHGFFFYFIAVRSQQETGIRKDFHKHSMKN